MICAWDLGADLPTASCGSFRCFSVDDTPNFAGIRGSGSDWMERNTMNDILNATFSPFLAYGNEQAPEQNWTMSYLSDSTK
jgi:hypothetical protein